MSHTNQELNLMLTAGKPLAVFCKAVGEDFDETGGQDFDAFVRTGDILKRRFYIKRKKYKLVYTAYFLPGQEWRVDVYRYLMREMEISWNSDMEFLQGFLLGYDGAAS